MLAKLWTDWIACEDPDEANSHERQLGAQNMNAIDRAAMAMWASQTADYAVSIRRHEGAWNDLADDYQEKWRRLAQTALNAAGAPGLLEALDELLDYRGGAPNALEDEYVMDRVRTALSKARGTE